MTLLRFADTAELITYLRLARREARLTQSWVASRVKRAQSTVSAWEGGKTSPPDDVLTRWASLFDLKLNLTATPGKPTAIRAEKR